MRICVVVPSTDYLHQAGARIRYTRLQPALMALGHSLDFQTTEQLLPEQGGFDVYLFSKCYDAGAVLLAMALRGRRCLVGIDLFDDMFSHAGDSRTVHYRRWIADMAPSLDFILCSTPRMAEIARDLVPDCPAHLMHDIWEPLDHRAIAGQIEKKRLQALATRTIRTAWFGVGDNPLFPVGLSDLSAFAADLQRIERSGFTVDLRILTNRRALTERGLMMIERLPVTTRVDEWSLFAEQDLLENSLLTFLPVNAQNFSIAKSLNRCISAIAAGTQVLSSGYPLYAALDDFIYRDAASFAADVETGALRVRDATIAGLRARLDDYGNPAVEAARLVAFVEALDIRPVTTPRLYDIVNGRRRSPVARIVAGNLGVLSISGLFQPRHPDDDAYMSGSIDNGDVRIEFSDRAVARLSPALRAELAYDEDGWAVLTIPVSAGEAHDLFAIDPDDLPGLTSSYEPAMRAMLAIFERLFPGINLLLSEHDAPLGGTLTVSAIAHLQRDEAMLHPRGRSNA